MVAPVKVTPPGTLNLLSVKVYVLSVVNVTMPEIEKIEFALAAPQAMAINAAPVNILRSEIILLSFLKPFFP